MQARAAGERRRARPARISQAQGGANAWGAHWKPGGQQYHWRLPRATDMRRPQLPALAPAPLPSRQTRAPTPRTPAGRQAGRQAVCRPEMA
eukprot:1707585-Pleurochrysis_carterae.AAC.1